MKFRTLGIVALVLLLITGIAQLEYRGVQWTMEYFTASTFGKTVALKLLVFTVIVFFSLVHDLYLGNLTIKAWKDDPNNSKTIRLRNISRLLGRVSFILALLAVWLGVVLVRGW